MSFPPGNVVVMPFVGADDENDGAVVPPQGSEFFEDIKGDYYDSLQNEDGEDRITRALQSSTLAELGGGHDGHRPCNADSRDCRLPLVHAPPRATESKMTTTMTTTTRRGGSPWMVMADAAAAAVDFIQRQGSR